MNVHTPVLLQQTIENLTFKEGDIFLDGTLGGGGHSAEVAKLLGKKIKIIGLDMDEDALRRGEEVLKSVDADFTLRKENFRNLDKVLDDLQVSKVTKILFDLGLSSNQLELTDRGFSFQEDQPLLMTFKKDPGESDVTAKVILNEWKEETIADIIFAYGEETFARRIAKAIVKAREEKPIETTHELVAIVKKATPMWYHFKKTHPATKTFQALRIATNDELQALEEGMRKGFERLERGGKMAIISFHSLEDRLVKHFYKKLADEGQAVVSKKPLVASEEEIATNPRSRSAKLRVLEKTT